MDLGHRSSDEIREELLNFEPTVESPWSFWERLTYKLTGRVSKRVYQERTLGMIHDDNRMKRLDRELRDAYERESRTVA